MDEQRFYPLRSPTPDLTTAAPLAQPPGSPTARTPTCSCAACPCAAECLQWRQQAGFWRSCFQRCQQREQRLRQQLAGLQASNWPQLLEQAQEREQILKQQVATLEARVGVLEHCLRGRQSEKKKRHAAAVVTSPAAPPRRRGQQPHNPAPSRRRFDQLPTQEETCQLPAAQQRCPHCGEPFAPFPGSDDGPLIEIDVRAYRRRYHRQRYRKTCPCAATPALLTAPPPPKLVPKSYLGVSVGVLLLWEKYAAYQPSYRFRALLRSRGVDLPLGTIPGGLHKRVPLFEPLDQALVEHQRQEQHWHCDETRWLVFTEQEGKSGPHWSLGVFCRPATVVFVLDPTRAHHVPETHRAGARGIASVDHASVYKAMAPVKEGPIVLAFCWAHVRRDFLEVLTGYAARGAGVASWLEDIRERYRRNDARCEALTAAPTSADPSAPPASADPSAPAAVAPGNPVAAVPSQSPAAAAAARCLREHVDQLAQRCQTELQQPDRHPACRKVLTSLPKHWSGLTVFLDHPAVPLDNNTAERAARGPVVARKNYYGSGAWWSGRLAAMLFALLQTLAVGNICPLRWLTAYLTACAEAGGRPPAPATAFLPWNLSAAQKQQWAMPSRQPPPATAADTS